MKVNRLAPGLAVLVVSLLITGVVARASGQEMSEPERRERCQNNLNLIAELEQQLAAEPPEAIWPDRCQERAVILLGVVENASRKNKLLVADDFTIRPTGCDGLDDDITKTFNKCMEGQTLGVFEIGDAARPCLIALAEGLRRAINDQNTISSQYYRLREDGPRQIQNCRTNLMALRCDQIGGTYNLEATWHLTQGAYTGWIILYQTGAALRGTVSWLNHGQSGTIQDGTVANGKVHFKVAYPSGDAGLYDGIISPSGKSMGGTAAGWLGGGNWSATRR